MSVKMDTGENGVSFLQVRCSSVVLSCHPSDVLGQILGHFRDAICPFLLPQRAHNGDLREDLQGLFCTVYFQLTYQRGGQAPVALAIWNQIGAEGMYDVRAFI
jgi:hypothetical protein